MIRRSMFYFTGLLVAIALVSATAGTAEAQGCGYGGGGYYGGGYYGGGHGRGISVSVGRGYGGYGYGGYGHGISVNYYRPSYYSQRPVWHDTSHLDYHPPVAVPHGNHYDVYPGHYHLHRTGHWDW
jgi:hypothetical protein